MSLAMPPKFQPAGKRKCMDVPETSPAKRQENSTFFDVDNLLDTLPAKRQRKAVSYNYDDFLGDVHEEDPPASPVGEGPPEESNDSEADDQFFESKSSRRKFLSRKAATAKRKAKLPAKSKVKKDFPFRFMDLPPELRDEIYSHALIPRQGMTLVAKTKDNKRTVARRTIIVETTRDYYGTKSKRYRFSPGLSSRPSTTAQIGTASGNLCPNLLAVCKQIHNEAIGVLYGQEIILEDSNALLYFLVTIGKKNRTLLSNLTLKGWGAGGGMSRANNFSAMAMLDTSVKLKSFFLDCSLAYSYYSQTPAIETARQLYSECYPFFGAYGAANGANDAALKILKVSPHSLRKKADTPFDPNEEIEVDPEKEAVFLNEMRRLLHT